MGDNIEASHIDTTDLPSKRGWTVEGKKEKDQVAKGEGVDLENEKTEERKRPV